MKNCFNCGHETKLHRTKGCEFRKYDIDIDDDEVRDLIKSNQHLAKDDFNYSNPICEGSIIKQVWILKEDSV